MWSLSCHASRKKAEVQREELRIGEMKDVDWVITTRELGYMLKEAGIDFRTLPEGEFDQILGESTGALHHFRFKLAASSKLLFERPMNGSHMKNCPMLISHN